MRQLSVFVIILICLAILISCFTATATKEGYEDLGTPDTNHNVPLPLTTTTSCRNFCGPQSQCALTRDQCTSDVDCPGCQPVLPPQNTFTTPDVRGQNDAGKLSYYTPQYSTLTTDMGTQAAFYTPTSKTATVAIPQTGSGPTATAKEGIRLFNKKNAYKRKQQGAQEWQFELHYPKRETTTGMFVDDGPLAANSYL